MDTEECDNGMHDSCTGYIGPELDPELCDCFCHEDQAEAIFSSWKDTAR